MISSPRELGALFKTLREAADLTQEHVARESESSISRTVVAHLEQGRKLPSAAVLEELGQIVGVPAEIIELFTTPRSRRRLSLEAALDELVGSSVKLASTAPEIVQAAEDQVSELFEQSPTDEQAYHLLMRILVFYGIPPMSREYFGRFFGSQAFRSLEAFRRRVEAYQKEAIRMFSTFQEAYRSLASAPNLAAVLAPLAPNNLEAFTRRTAWTCIESLRDEQLPNLGYVSAARVSREKNERQKLYEHLMELSGRIAIKGRSALDELSERRRRSIDSLLRKFGSTLRHDLSSPLFFPDPDRVAREAQLLAPKSEQDIAEMQQTQQIATRNLAHYLSADHMDVYVATSMRSDADFISVNRFVSALFGSSHSPGHAEVVGLKLRYFNPTQSWIEDRVAKGLVEALMLRRASVTIYMAQKEDTFGKDSEASVALGQGKPVIVYVPRLDAPEVGIDSATLRGLSARELRRLIEAESAEDVDLDGIDAEGLLARLLAMRLEGLSDEEAAAVAGRHWPDYDLQGEADRLEDPELSASYRRWLDEIARGAKEISAPGPAVRKALFSILVATTLRFEARARVFREVHPLALQVIFSTGVLNGMLVARSVNQCATLLRALLANELELELRSDDENYNLIEKTTGSCIRVISKHVLLQNAFTSFYGRFAPLSEP